MKSSFLHRKLEKHAQSINRGNALRIRGVDPQI